MQVFSNARQNLHITVFHFSHPADPRPDALDPHSGLGHVVAPQQSSTVSETASSQVVSQSVGNNRNHQLGAATTVVGGTTADVVTLLPAPGDRLGPTQQQLAREQSAASTVLSSISPFELQVCEGLSVSHHVSCLCCLSIASSGYWLSGQTEAEWSLVETTCTTEAVHCI